jgi:uncharacterized protein (DUF305 family)
VRFHKELLTNCSGFNDISDHHISGLAFESSKQADFLFKSEMIGHHEMIAVADARKPVFRSIAVEIVVILHNHG